MMSIKRNIILLTLVAIFGHRAIAAADAGVGFGGLNNRNVDNLRAAAAAANAVGGGERFARDFFGFENTDPEITRSFQNLVFEQARQDNTHNLRREERDHQAHLFRQNFSHVLTARNVGIVAVALAFTITVNYVAKEGAKHLFIKPPEIVIETSLPRTAFQYIFGVKNGYKSRMDDMVYNRDVWTQVNSISSKVKRSIFKKKPLINAMFYGSPGTGKTLAAKEIAMASGADFIRINASDLLQNDAETAIFEFKKMFNYARRSARGKPVVVIIDEADTVFSHREKSSEKSILLTSTFLGEVTSPSDPENMMFIFCTNRPKLDPAVLNRIGNGNKIFFSLPEIDARTELFSKYFQKNSPKGKFDIGILDESKYFAQKLEGWSGREIEQLSLDVSDWIESENRRMSFDTLNDIVDISKNNKLRLENSANQL